MNTTLHTGPLPVFLCTLWLYNDYYYDDDNYDPQWIHSCDRLISARNQQRAEALFIETLEKEQVYLPHVDDRQIEVSEFPNWPKYYSVEEFNAELIRDTESDPSGSTDQEGPAPVAEVIAVAYQTNSTVQTIWRNELAGNQQIDLIGEHICLNFLTRFARRIRVLRIETHRHGHLQHIELCVSG
jgi:hypothetical protein